MTTETQFIPALPEQNEARAWRAFWSAGLSPRVLTFALVIAVFVVFAIVPGLFAPMDPNLTNLAARLMPPGTTVNGQHFWLGTDDLGRDILSRVIWGARVSLPVSIGAVIAAGLFGSILGVLAGFYQGVLGTIIMRVADMVLAIPFFLLAILVAAVLGPSLLNLIIVLAFVRWPRYTRIAFGQTLDASQRDFVKAVRALGARPSRLIVRHLVPEVLPALIVVATLELGLMILYEAAMSFIGLGVQPPTSSWGAMLAEGQNYISLAWWLTTFPGVALFLLVMSVNMLGDYVRDLFDPRQQSLRS